MAPPNFAENTDMAKDLDYKTGLDFWGLFFLEKSPSYRRINTVPNNIISFEQLRPGGRVVSAPTVDDNVVGLNLFLGQNPTHGCMALHCTEPFIIIFQLSL